MPIRVQAPDGSIVQFPDGTDPAVMQSAMAAQFGAPKTTPGVQAPTDASAVAGSLRAQTPLEQLRSQGPIGQLGAEVGLMGDATAEGFIGLGDIVFDALKFAGDGVIDSAKGVGELLNPFATPGLQTPQDLTPGAFLQDNVPSLREVKNNVVDPALEQIGIVDFNVNELSPADRFKYRFSEAAIPAALTLGAATAPKAGQATVSLADDVFAGVKNQIRAKPIRASAEEIAASAGGAAGLTLAEEMDVGPLGQAGAALGGAVLASPLAATPFAIADNATGAATKATQARIVQDAALNPKLAASKIAEDLDAARSIGATPPSALLSSDDEGLIAMERALRTKPDFAPKATAVERQFRSDLVDTVSDIRPVGADTRAPQRVAAAKQADRLAKQNARQTDAQSRLDDVARKAGENRQNAAAPLTGAKGGAADASRELDETVVEGVLKPRRTARNERYARIDPNRSVDVDTTSIRTALDDVRAGSGTQFQGRLTPTKELEELDALINGDGPVSFADLQDARSALSAAIRDASVGVDGNKAPPFVEKLRALKKSIDDLDPDALADPKAAARATEAKRFHETEFAPFFGRGAGKQLRRAIDNDDFTRSNSSPADTAGRFFLKTGRRSEDAAQDLREILSIAPDEAAGRQAVRNYLFASASRTMDGDTVNPARLRKWMENHQGPLRQFPEVDAELKGVLKSAINAGKKGDEAISAAKNDLARIAKEAKLSDAEFNKSAASIFLNNDPEKAVAKIMAANDRQKAMRDAVKLVSKDPQAKKGFKAAVSDWLKESISGTAGGRTANDADPITVGALTKALRRNRNTLAKVYAEEEIKALESVNKLLRTAARADNARPSMQSVTAELDAAEIDTTLLEAALKSKYGVLKGGSIMRIAGGLIGRAQELTGTSRAARAAQWREFLLDVSTDPEKAIHLLNFEDTPAWEKKLSRLFLVTEALDEDAPEEDE